jgi:hypothetical protein
LDGQQPIFSHKFWERDDADGDGKTVDESNGFLGKTVAWLASRCSDSR